MPHAIPRRLGTSDFARDRARYLVTRTAKIAALARRILSDRAFDRLGGKNYKLDEVRDAIFRGANKQQSRKRPAASRRLGFAS